MAMFLRARNYGPSFRTPRGFTLTELAIVLGVIGTIIGGIWVAAAQVYANNQTRLASGEVAQIVANWRSFFGNRTVDVGDADPGNNLTQLTVSNNFAPSEMVPGTCTAYGTKVAAPADCLLDGAFPNSTVNIYANTSTNSISLDYGNLTQQGCNNFANAIMSANGLKAITASGTALAVPDTSTDVDAACTKAGTGNDVLVQFSLN